MLKKFLAFPLVTLALLIGSVHADENTVKQTVEARLGGKVDAVKKTPHLGLYEVRIGDKLIYTDDQADYIFTGNIIDTKTRQNLTQERLKKLSEIKFSDLPLDLAIKTVRGDGKRVIATFEDPNCGYCKHLAKELQGIDNITVYTFLLPILSQDSTDKAKAVWCAADRTKAWNDLMVKGATPPAGNCETPIEKIIALGGKLNVHGTPIIFLSNGERISGALPAAKLEDALNKIVPGA